MRFRILLLGLLLGSLGFALSATDSLPPVLDRIDNPERLTILAIDRSGERAVGAMPADDKGERSVIMFYSAADPEVVAVEVPTQVRALLLPRDDLSVYAIMRKDSKRGEGETFLSLIDPGSAKAKRLLRLPHSAVDLDYWSEHDSLLVSCKNEIRTLLLPEMRSGPLYRVRGNNRAVASLAGGNLILVGQDEGLLLVDLDATHGKEEMPVQSEIPLPQPVNSISAAADGSYALVTLADDSVQTVNIDTLMPAAPPEPEPEPIEEEVAEEPLPEPEPVVEEAIEEPVIEPEPEPIVEEGVEEHLPEPVVVAEIVEEPIPEPEPVVEEAIEEPVIEPEPEPIVEEVVQEPTPEPAKTTPQVRGKITGDDLSAVVAVVLLGPNNMLREAARISPKNDGSWSADGLATGKYRVQLDGGGSRVLVTDPPFMLIDVEEDGTADAGEIRLLKTL
jgi:hypothetical protein